MELHRQSLVRAKLYEQVAKILETRIIEGSLPKDSYLPNEFDLSQEFGVSIGTVRKAVDMLVAGYLLERQPGKGTKIADRRWIEIRDKANRIRHGDNASTVTWDFKEIERTIKPATSEVARKLNIPTGSEVEFVCRLRHTPDGSCALDNAFFKKGTPSDFTDSGPGRVIAMMNTGGIGRVEEYCWAVQASERAATLMQIKIGEPLLKMVRVMNNNAGEPIEFRECYLHTRECYYYTCVD